MLERHISRMVADRLADNPAVALVGPRQSGKTTLARSLSKIYFDLEQEADRLRLDLDWEQTRLGRDLVVLDEAQSWPEVFPRLRGAIDQDRSRKGRFLLLGSVSPQLMTQVSESLAGRLAIVELTPLLLSELRGEASRQRTWLMGGFPDGGVLSPRRFPVWQSDYLKLLIQRDLPNWGLTARPQTTNRFVRMLAALHGQAWNASQLAKSLGVSYHTVNAYLEYLIGAFLIRLLPPYHANIKKRLTKSPKVYWRDSGILHSLLNVRDRSVLLQQPWVGASWEGFVIEQILGTLSSLGRQFDSYHLRTSDQHEIDLLLDSGDELCAIEVKLTTSPGLQDLQRLERTADLVGASRRYLVSQTKAPAGNDRSASTNLPELLQRLLELLPGV